jgi:predicted nicotinamide N-methyase
VAGKTVLDVGTASGYVAFAAEEAGASRVTALDAPDAGEFERIPFRGSAFTERHGEWVGHTDQYLTALKKSFWYSWHKKKSGVEAVYAPVSALRAWDRTFDVVIAGAIVEHISDPVPFIASLARLAREAVIIAFTPHLPTEDQVMTTMNDWSNPVYDYSWWMLSLGLYRRVFANLGFAITTVPAVARCNEYDFPLDVTRPTIVAVRNA